MFTVKTNSLVTAIALTALSACVSSEPESSVASETELSQPMDFVATTNPVINVKPTPEEWTGGGTEITDLELPADPIEPFTDSDDNRFPVEIRHGENLVSLAELAETSVDAIAELNRLSDFDSLVVGQEIYIPIPEDQSGTLSDSFVVSFDERRDMARADRVERFENQSGGLIVMRTHRVKTGETAWGLSSSEFEVPLWVLAYYNPDVNLERLRIGQELHYPLVQSTVEAELAQSDGEGETAAAEPSYDESTE
jgi:hypothetical protein